MRKIVGANFKEKIWMPVSGDSTNILIFPPLDKKTKRINFNDQIFGISLDENLANLKPNPIIPEKVNNWLNEECTKNTQKPYKDFKSNDFFKEGTAKIVGYIKGYSVKSDMTTGVIYQGNSITHEDSPLVVEIKEDGRFEVEIPIKCPQYSAINFGRRSIPFYVEQGQTLAIILEWDEFLKADRLRDHRYRFKDIKFKGSLALINVNLKDYSVIKTDGFKYRDLTRKWSIEENISYLNAEKDMEMQILDIYAKRNHIRAKAVEILKNKALLNYAEGMFSIDMHRSMKARRDTSNKELQKPLPDDYYTFLKQIPLENQSIFINNNIDVFLNRYEYSSIINRFRPKSINHSPSKSIFQFLLENEKLLIKEDKEMCELMIKKDKTEDEVERLKDLSFDWEIFKERYSKNVAVWSKKATQEQFKSDIEKWKTHQVEFAEKNNINNKFILDVIKIRSLKYKFQSFESDKEGALLMWNNIKSTIQSDYLIAIGDQLFNKKFSNESKQAYELPAGKATDIFNKIIAPHKGKILFIDFWATSCGPCVGGIKRMKETRKEYENHKDIDFVFITDKRGSQEKKYNEFVKEQELKNTYRISADEYLYLRQLFKFNGIPRYVVIDKDGKVISDNFSMYQFKTEVVKILETNNKNLTQK